MFKIILTMFIGVGLSGCSPNMDVKPVQFGESKGIVSGGNLRLVTERTRSSTQRIVCSEPSPDYAVAFGSNPSVKLKPPEGSTQRDVEIGTTTSEYVLEGEGRAEAVLALRDGLYTACQSYANGIIGKDAYAIILSQYGNLLLGLVGRAGASVAQASGPHAAFSAMTVACISGHDGTRPGSASNSLLTYPFCLEILRKAIARSEKPPLVGAVTVVPNNSSPRGASGSSPPTGAGGTPKTNG